MVNNIDAQTWLNEKYPIDGICERKSDPTNKGKKRDQITELDIGRGNLGKTFWGGEGDKNLVGSLKLEGFTNLRTLIISSHQITNLDMSLCGYLEKLDCRGNQLNSLNVAGCRYLSEINCSDNYIRELDLSTCTNLNDVDINNCPNLAIEKIKSDLHHDTENNKLVKTGPQISHVKEDEVRNILIVGITGNGKSALANVLAGDGKFTERASTTSVTKNFQESSIFEWEKDEKKIKYRVIDNTGFNDTENLTAIDILHEIGKGIYSAKNKINQILFVVSGRFTPEQMAAFKLFKDFISESRITEFTTIIRTRFNGFRNKAKCEEDQQALLSESDELKRIINSCNGIVHVDNPSIPTIERGDNESEKEDKEQEIRINKRKREESRKIVLDYLVESCQEVYKLKEWESIHNQIVKYIKKIEEKQKELEKVKNNQEKKSKLQSELKEERKKFAEEINAKLGIKVSINPEVYAEVEFKDIKCCSIS